MRRLPQFMKKKIMETINRFRTQKIRQSHIWRKLQLSQSIKLPANREFGSQKPQRFKIRN
jgi:hypothetical protein